MTQEATSVVHISVPAPLKARWVKSSQARGQKLTDWIIEKLESCGMNVYPIPESLAGSYHGAGYALAAISGGRVVALRYIADHANEQLQDALAEGGATAEIAARRWIASQAAGPVVRELQALGQVSVGMCSSWEFVEL